MVQFGNIGRMQIFEYFLSLFGIVFCNDIPYVFDIFFGKFIHVGRLLYGKNDFDFFC